ncbi:MULTISPECIES: hypothetical protein [unclassified Nocardia]|uniref:hypothetical protein n=1 Tax=Nocardia sp. JW2 TaxID=3450738 RepID=UPI003F4428F8
MIFRTDDTMRSDRTPEYAERVGPDSWTLSWLPGYLLTTEQARAGMELDELVSDLGMAYDRIAHAEISARADILGMMWQQALIKLAKRLDARAGREPAGESFHDPPDRRVGWGPPKLPHGDRARNVYYG